MRNWLQPLYELCQCKWFIGDPVRYVFTDHSRNELAEVLHVAFDVANRTMLYRIRITEGEWVDREWQVWANELDYIERER